MMSDSWPAHVVLFFLLCFCTSFFQFSYCTRNNGNVRCPEIEKQTLLSFKKFSTGLSNSNMLSSWREQVDCCTWKGVVCNNLTGHVHELHLQSPSSELNLLGELNPSLLNLKHLRYLDLSWNSFEGTFPTFIGSFAHLEYLDLSDNELFGVIPQTIGNLSNLRTLSLQQRVFGVSVDNLQWLSGLSHLEHLNMNYVNLSKANNNWLQVINTLPSLVELQLQGCGLEFITPSNITKLQYLDLSFNNFNSTIPNWIYTNKHLEFLDISGNSLHGSISNAIGNLTSLSYLDIGSNELSGEIPNEIAHMCEMKMLSLSSNKLQGEISNAFGNMSDCFLGFLESLELGSNKLSGHLTSQFGEFKNLQRLTLERNSLSGPIPVNVGKLSSLYNLNLEDNKFTGNLPESFGQLLNLGILNINDNMLQGVVTESHFANLTKLNQFSATGNHLSFKVDQNWIPPFKLYILELGSWDLGAGTQIPSWLETQKNSIISIDLSNTGISHQVPDWFWKIETLNLSHNQLHGKIPHISGPRYVYLSSNNFNGSLPRVGNEIRHLDLSNNSISGTTSHFLSDMPFDFYALEILLLGGNRLSGELPDCWTKFQWLIVLNLQSNNISGSIPNSIGLLTQLGSLNLYNNSLSGQIPYSIQNCTDLLKIDLARNNLVGNIPAWNGRRLSNLRILILRSNKLNGKIPSSICHLNSLQILDLSDNIFSGKIPKCFDNFTAMTTKRELLEYGTRGMGFTYSYPTNSSHEGTFLESASLTTKGMVMEYDTILALVTSIDLSRNNLSGEIPKQLTSLVRLRSLNLSMNHLRGTIPDGIGEMKQLESLDLSRNTLSGEIPNTLQVLTSLDFLNLSFNNLTGKIPESTQLQSLNASSFIGNKLCGPPLTIKCNNGGGDQTSDPGYHEDKNRDVKSKVDWFYILLSLGYAVGFSAVCTTLVLKKTWRDAYFQALDDMWNKIYVYANIKFRKNTID